MYLNTIVLTSNCSYKLWRKGERMEVGGKRKEGEVIFVFLLLFSD